MSLNPTSYRLMNTPASPAAQPQAPIGDGKRKGPKAMLTGVRQDARKYQSTYAPPASAPVENWQLQGFSDVLSQLLGTTSPTTPAPAAPATSSLLSSFQHLLGSTLDALQGLLGWHPAPPSAPPSVPPTTPSNPAPSGPGTNFVISSFNVLGNTHTEPGGEKPWMGPGVQRIQNVAKLIEAHNVDVVGFQEFQGPQYKEFMKVAGDKYAVYPGLSHGESECENSIAWRKDKWDLVKADSVTVPYFEGQHRKMPVLLMKNKQTGQEAYFVNIHNPADTAKHHQQEQWRNIATNNEVALINKLKATGLPVFCTGDFNENTEAYTDIHGRTGLQAAMAPNGKLPKRTGIDWIFGTNNVQFSHYGRDRGALEQKTSDHPMVYSQVHIGK